MQLETAELGNILSFSAELSRLENLDAFFWDRVFDCLSDLFGYKNLQFFPYADCSFDIPLVKARQKNASLDQVKASATEIDYWLKHYSFLDPFNPVNYPPHLRNQKVILLKDVAAEFETPKLMDYWEYRKRNEVADQMTASIYSNGNLRGCLVVSQSSDGPPLTERDRYLFGVLTEYLEDRFNTLTTITSQKLQIQFLQASLNSINEGIAILDTQYSVTYINQTAKKIILSLMNLRDIDYATRMLVTRRILPNQSRTTTISGFLDHYSYQLVPAVMPVSIGKPAVMYVLHLKPVEKMIPFIEEYADQYHLTTRETDILAMILSGKSNQQIANALFISLPTIKTHVANIFRKFGVSRRMELINKLQHLPEPLE